MVFYYQINFILYDLGKEKCAVHKFSPHSFSLSSYIHKIAIFCSGNFLANKKSLLILKCMSLYGNSAALNNYSIYSLMINIAVIVLWPASKT